MTSNTALGYALVLDHQAREKDCTEINPTCPLQPYPISCPAPDTVAGRGLHSLAHGSVKLVLQRLSGRLQNEPAVLPSGTMTV